jgi:hypothetical protein
VRDCQRRIRARNPIRYRALGAFPYDAQERRAPFAGLFRAADHRLWIFQAPPSIYKNFDTIEFLAR